MKKPRTKILFKINGEVVVEELSDLYLNQIDEMKWIIAQECECSYDDIDVDYETPDKELSDYDVTPDGIVNFKDTFFTPVTGIRSKVDTDTLLDAMSKGWPVENCFELF